MRGASGSALSASGLPHRAFGKTGIPIPIVSLGTSRLGHPEISFAAAEGVFECALQEGLTYIDVAPHYGNAEEKLRPFLRKQRAKVLLASKVLASRPGHREALLQIEEILRRTGAGYLDVVHVHSAGDWAYDDLFGAEGTLTGLYEARDKQLARYIGLSAHHRATYVSSIIAAAHFDVVMLPLNIVDRHGYDFETDALPQAETAGAAILAMKVLGGTQPHSGPESTGYLADYAGGALAYSLDLPGVASVVVGCCTQDQVTRLAESARGYRPQTGDERSRFLANGRALFKQVGHRWGAPR